ncbi:hypothetical protein JSY36_05000 [Bacillus sp. H-16]|uniref:hypothetical protein n=1 Tax=Alteribacter salitolerans TaxID=2912333 RepID=UPI0019648310|nr:hypothetical protein [Alteribacter salitolerans]MBM7095110.1 hypothetical protein [Alteribacter salitolerans]
MKKILTGAFVLLLLLAGYDLLSEETFKVTGLEEGLFTVKSSKVLNPTFRTVRVNAEAAEIRGREDAVIDIEDIQVGDKVKVTFSRLVALADPPIVKSTKVVLLK